MKFSRRFRIERIRETEILEGEFVQRRGQRLEDLLRRVRAETAGGGQTRNPTEARRRT